MFQSDVYLVVGIVIAALAIPSLLGAFADRRMPRIALILLLIAVVLIGLAMYRQPGVYTLTEVPNAFVRVIAAVIR